MSEQQALLPLKEMARTMTCTIKSPRGSQAIEPAHSQLAVLTVAMLPLCLDDSSKSLLE